MANSIKADFTVRQRIVVIGRLDVRYQYELPKSLLAPINHWSTAGQQIAVIIIWCSHERSTRAYWLFADSSRRLAAMQKGKFLYSAVSSPQDRSKRFTLYFPDRPVHSDTISASLGSIQPYAIINAWRLLVHISTSAYSHILIYTAEWTGAMCPINVLTPQHRIQTCVLLIESLKLYPWAIALYHIVRGNVIHKENCLHNTRI